MIVIELPGVPVPKGRPRFLRNPIRRKDGKGYRFAITAAATRVYESGLALTAKAVMRGKPPLKGPIRLLVQAFLPIPPSWSQRKQRAARAGARHPTSKPDYDNLIKITDALNGVVWVDDAQVVDGRIIKRYADKPRLRIEIEEIEHAVDA